MSESGFYHVVCKGDGGRVLFEGDRDRLKYLKLLAREADAHFMKLHAYCLMSNHVHLLVQDTKENISSFMKRLNESYAHYFTWSTERVGHVFQRRFWSEPIDTDERFLATLRYIHANPETAGICRTEDYPWSSYCAYVDGSTSAQKAGLPCVEVDFSFALLGSKESFVRFSQSGCKYPRPFPESKMKGHLSADELVNVAIGLLGRETLNGLPAMEPSDRMPYLVQLSQAGFRVNEIARVSGIAQASISRSLNAQVDIARNCSLT